NRREFRAVTRGILHRSGGAQTNTVDFKFEKIVSYTYNIQVTGIEQGEYGLLAPGAVASATVASSGRIYTFRIPDKEPVSNEGHVERDSGIYVQRTARGASRSAGSGWMIFETSCVTWTRGRQARRSTASTTTKAISRATSVQQRNRRKKIVASATLV